MIEIPIDYMYVFNMLFELNGDWALKQSCNCYSDHPSTSSESPCKLTHKVRVLLITVEFHVTGCN